MLATGASCTSKHFAQSRNVAAQSQVRCGWGCADPRFVPLSGRGQGAWLDNELPVTGTNQHKTEKPTAVVEKVATSLEQYLGLHTRSRKHTT